MGCGRWGNAKNPTLSTVEWAVGGWRWGNAKNPTYFGLVLMRRGGRCLGAWVAFLAVLISAALGLRFFRWLTCWYAFSGYMSPATHRRTWVSKSQPETPATRSHHRVGIGSA